MTNKRVIRIASRSLPHRSSVIPHNRIRMLHLTAKRKPGHNMQSSGFGLQSAVALMGMLGLTFLERFRLWGSNFRQCYRHFKCRMYQVCFGILRYEKMPQLITATVDASQGFDVKIFSWSPTSNDSGEVQGIGTMNRIFFIIISSSFEFVLIVVRFSDQIPCLKSNQLQDLCLAN